MNQNPMADDLMRQLRLMWRIRLFEEQVREFKLAGQVAGSVHLCIGQEAIPVGAVSALNLEIDMVFATYRGHGWAIACGSDLTGLFAELCGRATGINGGRAGSAYLSDPRVGFYGENSIVGAGTPHAVGAALAGRFDGTGRVALTSFGDGAVNQGSVHESMNMAAAFRLPVIFLLENNRYSELTPIASMVGNELLVDRARTYGFEGVRVDGNDPVEVARAVSLARQRAIDGQGPMLIEALTERLVGHYIGDAEHYRPRGEVEAAWEKEPITRLCAALRAMGHTSDVLTAIEDEERAAVGQAAAAALQAPTADPATATEFIYGQ